jgi:hypothetical protein
VPVLPGPGRHVVATLAGVTPADLGGWSAALAR